MPTHFIRETGDIVNELVGAPFAKRAQSAAFRRMRASREVSVHLQRRPTLPTITNASVIGRKINNGFVLYISQYYFYA